MSSSQASDAGRDLLIALLAKVAAEDRTALNQLYALTSAKLNGIVLRVVREQASADDVLQDVYLNIWRKAASFDPASGSPITWMAAIARNRAIDRLRAERRRGGADGGWSHSPEPLDGVEIADDAMLPLERLIVAEDRQQLLCCLGRIDHDQRRAIHTTFFEGLTYDELARRENTPLSTIKSRIRRGLLKLRECLEHTGTDKDTDSDER